MSKYMSKSFEEVLFTHNDLDGAGCSILYNLAHPFFLYEGKFKIYNCSNENIDRVVQEALDNGEVDFLTKVTFGDIVCCRELLTKVVSICKSVEIYDHHRTNLWAEDICPNSVIVPENKFSEPQCGTSLMYQHYCQMAFMHSRDLTYSEFESNDETERHIQRLAKFVDTIRSYDTWEWKSTGNIMAKELQILCSLLGLEEFIKYYSKYLLYINPTYGPIISPEDYRFIKARLHAERDRMNKFSREDVIECNVRGLKTVLALNTIGMNISDLASKFLEENPDIDMFAGFSLPDGTFQFRTRRDDLNLGEFIAEPIGGGGHPQAAGAVISKELKQVFAELLISAMNGNELVLQIKEVN